MARARFLKAPADTRFILASASPRREALLRQIGAVPDLILPADLDEAPRARELPAPHAARMAAAKAAAVAARHPGAIVLGADTVVARGRRILPKPDSPAEARTCLELLSGCRHRVHGAVAVIGPDGRMATRLVTSIVGFKRLERIEIEAALAGGEWRGKAGGYAIQGAAAAFARYLRGSYSNVVGLPLHETYTMLRAIGFAVGIDSGKPR